MSKTFSSLALVFCVLATVAGEAKEKSASSAPSRDPASVVSTEGMRKPVAKNPAWYRDVTSQPSSSRVSNIDWGSQVGPIRVVKPTSGKDLGRLNK